VSGKKITRAEKHSSQHTSLSDVPRHRFANAQTHNRTDQTLTGPDTQIRKRRKLPPHRSDSHTSRHATSQTLKLTIAQTHRRHANAHTRRLTAGHKMTARAGTQEFASSKKKRWRRKSRREKMYAARPKISLKQKTKIDETYK
jgi:hypothetical protein